MGWTNPTTRTSDEFIETPDWNTDLTDNLDYLKAEVDKLSGTHQIIWKSTPDTLLDIPAGMGYQTSSIPWTDSSVASEAPNATIIWIHIAAAVNAIAAPGDSVSLEFRKNGDTPDKNPIVYMSFENGDTSGQYNYIIVGVDSQIFEYKVTLLGNGEVSFLAYLLGYAEPAS